MLALQSTLLRAMSRWRLPTQHLKGFGNGEMSFLAYQGHTISEVISMLTSIIIFAAKNEERVNYNKSCFSAFGGYGVIRD